MSSKVLEYMLMLTEQCRLWGALVFWDAEICTVTIMHTAAE